jgi:beta-xylosidase
VFFIVRLGSANIKASANILNIFAIFVTQKITQKSMNMSKKLSAVLAAAALYLAGTTGARAQGQYDESYYQEVKTYVNQVLPGDHPDPTLLKVGDDFYHCGSTFHFNPYLPIYHSKDLVHWEVISRVLPPSMAEFVSDRPSSGIWQGAITHFYGSWWIYFSSGGQWFSKADSPKGPWSKPVRVETNPKTGSLGYDNSIFVDTDGKPYMVIKNGQLVNRIQAIGRDGQLTDTVINCDFINGKHQYSWAEGPVMCKRGDYYYYFPAGDVSGGQYVLRTKELSADESKWERLGEFFKPITDPNVGFRRPNHMSAPVQLSDGTWWCIAQSYEKYNTDDWSGTGRQTGLYQVIWEGDRPWGVAPTTQPVTKPNLPQGGILWRSVQTDRFETGTLDNCWHFLTHKAYGCASFTARKGWLRLTPNGEMTHILQKETDHYYTCVTKVDLNASQANAKAGFYITNGNQKTFAQFYTGNEDGAQKLVFKLGNTVRSTANTVGQVVYLKLERVLHNVTAYYSADGKKWTSMGEPISFVDIDKNQPNYNSWVGTSLGLFAEGQPADFDFFVCKDGYSSLKAAGYSNYFGVKTLENGSVTNTSDKGGWFMISGVEMGETAPSAMEVEVSGTAKKATLDVFADDLKTGKKLATVSISPSAKSKTITAKIQGLAGHHDVFIRFPKGENGTIRIESIRFVK